MNSFLIILLAAWLVFSGVTTAVYWGEEHHVVHTTGAHR